MAAKKKTVMRKPLVNKPTKTLIKKALEQHGAKGSRRNGPRDAPYRVRKSFRHYSTRTVETVWAFVAVTDKAGAPVFTYQQIAEVTGLPPHAVGEMARCKPD